MRMKNISPAGVFIFMALLTLWSSFSLAEAGIGETATSQIKTDNNTEKVKITLRSHAKRPTENKTNLINKLFTCATKASAHITIFSAELIATDAAEKELEQFRKGSHDGLPTNYSESSDGTKELLQGDYYRELTDHLVEELAKWYGKKIPHSGGLFTQSNSFRVFSPNDAIIEFGDGIGMADIIGTMGYYVRMSTHDGNIYFQGINKMSLESYAGTNYLKHNLVNNPEAEAFSSTTQVFNWSLPIPEEYCD